VRRNFELKARCSDLDHARAAARDLGAVPDCVLLQHDTFFPSANGRLKLREIEGAGTELIWYDRPNHEGARLSRFRIVPAPDGLKEALTLALGTSGIVRKRRELLLWHNIRIHLDQVEGLGTFVEFEAVLDENDDLQLAHERLDKLAGALHLGERIATSYMEEIDGLQR